MYLILTNTVTNCEARKQRHHFLTPEPPLLVHIPSLFHVNNCRNISVEYLSHYRIACRLPRRLDKALGLLWSKVESQRNRAEFLTQTKKFEAETLLIKVWREFGRLRRKDQLNLAEITKTEKEFSILKEQVDRFGPNYYVRKSLGPVGVECTANNLRLSQG